MTLPKTIRLALFATVLFGVSVVGVHAVEKEVKDPAYIDRALDVPELGVDDECPVSIGDNNVVSSEHGYIFGAGGYFFGAGPVYLALSWKPWDRAEAWFELDPRTLSADGYRLKTPWIMDPQYVGAALIRGVQLGADTQNEILFAENTQAQPITRNMVLRSDTTGTLVPDSYEQTVDAIWGFWPSHVIVSGPGCYVIQIDSEDGSETVVFEAKGQG